MSSTKTLVILAFFAVAALANPSLRLKRAPEPQTEAIGEFTARQGTNHSIITVLIMIRKIIFQMEPQLS